MKTSLRNLKFNTKKKENTQIKITELTISNYFHHISP